MQETWFVGAAARIERADRGVGSTNAIPGTAEAVGRAESAPYPSDNKEKHASACFFFVALLILYPLIFIFDFHVTFHGSDVKTAARHFEGIHIGMLCEP